jgi:hypothetical protein
MSARLAARRPNGLELSCQLSTTCDHYVLHRSARCHGQLQRVVRLLRRCSAIGRSKLESGPNEILDSLHGGANCACEWVLLWTTEIIVDYLIDLLELMKVSISRRVLQISQVHLNMGIQLSNASIEGGEDVSDVFSP